MWMILTLTVFFLNDKVLFCQSKQTSLFWRKSGNSDLNEQQKEILTQFLNQNRNVFATNLQELGKTNLYKHTIDTDIRFWNVQ
jgi:dsDNA-binding SOS-regulon protein